MILCLADDLTGLVELAAQCANQGLFGEVCFSPDHLPTKTRQPLIFVNLACRDQDGSAAQQRVRNVLLRLTHAAISHIYLKLDSVARGPLAGMLRGILDATGSSPIPLLLANPQTGRAIRQGVIWIGEKLLQNTSFARDPLHPATVSSLPEILTRSHPRLSIAVAGQHEAEVDVIVLDGQSQAEIGKCACQFAHAVAAAGAAPFGVELLRRWCVADAQASQVSSRLRISRLLVVSGTQHPAGKCLEDEFRTAGGCVIQPSGLPYQVSLPLLLHSRAMRGEPRAIGAELARATEQLVARLQPAGLMLTGGETAQAVLGRLCIHAARPICYAHSVAELRVPEVTSGSVRRLWIKPGSYGQQGLLERLFELDFATGMQATPP